MEDNLQILMPVTFTEGCDSYVSLRDFHEFLGIGDSFRIWAEKILNYGFVENEDYKVVYQENSVIAKLKSNLPLSNDDVLELEKLILSIFPSFTGLTFIGVSLHSLLPSCTFSV